MPSNTKTPTVTFEAIRTTQNGTTIYVGVAPAKDLLQVTTIDRYDHQLSPTDERQGYQRPPERSRITRIGTFLLENGMQTLFPTAVLLAAREPLVYDKRQGTITVSSETALRIVDGQHRLAGLEYVINEKGEAAFENFVVPFVIMETADRLTEMNQFRIINGTVKSVRTDLVNMLLTAVYDASPRREVPKREQWRIVVSNVVERLAKQPDSPWQDMVALPGEVTTRGSGKIRATSFITSLRPVYVMLKEATGILDYACATLDEEIDYLYRVVADYWAALKEVVPDAFGAPEEYVIQKTPGLFSLHMLLKHLLTDMFRGRRDFDTATFVEFLSESPEITDANFWHKDAGRASVYGSMKGFSELYDLISEAYR